MQVMHVIRSSNGDRARRVTIKSNDRADYIGCLMNGYFALAII